MQIEIKLKRILPILLGLLLLWSCFILAVFLLGKSDNNNQAYVPKQADFVLNIDAKSFFQTAAYDVFFAAQDDELIQQIERFSASNKTSETWNDAGIDLFSDVIYYQQTIRGEKVAGVLFNLIDSKKFIPAFSKNKSRNQFTAVHEHVGLLLLGNSKTTQRDAEHVLQGAHQPMPTMATKSANQLLRGTTQANPLLGTGMFALDIQNQQLTIQGDFTARQSHPVPWTLKSDGFHLSYGLFSTTVQDSLSRMFEAQGFDMPAIAHAAINYRGTSVGKETVLPDGELLIHCTKPISKAQFLQADSVWRKWGFTIETVTNNTLILLRENKAYTLRFLDDETLFFGVKTTNILQKSEKHLFLMEGDVSNLTEINGGGLGALGLSFYPPFKASKYYFNAIDAVKIELKPVHGKLKLDGKLTMKDKQLVIPEIVRFFLTMRPN